MLWAVLPGLGHPAARLGRRFPVWRVPLGSHFTENTDIVSSLPLGGLHASPSLAGTALPQWGPYRSHAGRGPQAYSFPVVCIALPRQAQFMWNQCIVPWMDRVRLTRASFLKASGPMVGMSCLSLYHDDPGSHLCLRYPKMTSLVLSAQC